MASKKRHCAACIAEFGKPFEEVHEWLDECASVWKDGVHYIDINHRYKRHHREGIEVVRKMFGDDAALAAENHIKLDFGGKIPNKADYNPKFCKEELKEWDKLFGPWNK